MFYDKLYLNSIVVLSGRDWFIKMVDPANGPEQDPLFDAGSSTWIPAQVPGNIQSDLESAHQLKPLWYGLGDPALADVARHDWWYGKKFSVSDEALKKKAQLVFHGVDFTCDIWLNKVRLGTHHGMFQKFWFDVTGLLKAADNELSIKIHRMPEQLLPYLLGSDGPESGYRSPYWFVHGMNKTRQTLKGLKSSTNFSYDWGTNVWTLGIWKDVSLELSGPVTIEWMQVQSHLTDQYTQAALSFTLEVDSPGDMPVRAIYSVSGHGADDQAVEQIQLDEGKNRIQGRLTIRNPALWWPNGQGEQPLYTVTARIESDDGLLDCKTAKLGIREVRWEPVEGAPADFINPFRLLINGRPVRTMGSNLMPPDLLFGRIMERGPRLLRLAREAGMNMLRIWGGGVILPDALYDLADEMGLMLSLEFPIANCLPEDDPVFLASLDETIRNIIKQLRHHPSIIEWTGGNEMSWKQGDPYPALRVMEQAVQTEDSRLFRATCPVQGARHSPWHYDPQTHYTHYNTINVMRYGEFGCQTPAHLETWHREIPPESQWPVDGLDDPVLIRKNVSRAVFGTDFWLLKKYIDQLFGPLPNLESLVKAGQLLGAEGLRYAMDALRRLGPKIGGFTSWDYNEPWPNGAGSYLVDYDGRPLMNYSYVRQALAPVSLALQYDAILFEPGEGMDADLFMVSDDPEVVSGLSWQWIIWDRTGRPVRQGAGKTEANPRTVSKLARINICLKDETCAAPLIAALFLRDQNEQLISERLYVFGRKDQQAPLGGLLRGTPEEAVAQTVLTLESAEPGQDPVQDTLAITLKNTGRMAALFCEPHPLLAYRTDFSLNENHLLIPPGESRTLILKAPAQSACGLNLAQTGWMISCWNAEDVILQPSGDVILSVGRQDALCREFDTRPDSGPAASHADAVFSGSKGIASEIHYLLGQGSRNLCFKFDMDQTLVGRPARLRIHTADQSSLVETAVELTVNGQLFHAVLTKGLGIQDRDPAHLAFPHSIETTLPAGLLRTAGNELAICVANEGWFTWDALDLVAL